jgi:hypothetical protein
MSTPASGPVLRKSQANSSAERQARPKRAGDGGEKGTKMQRQQESRTQNALVFLGIMSLLFIAGMVKLRHNPSVSKSHKLGSLRSNTIPHKESLALEEVTRGTNALFIPPHSIYSLSVSDYTGNMVSLNQFHGMVTLIVNVACL